MSNYLDKEGLLYLWGKIKTLMSGKVDKVSGKGLSSNDYTTSEKNKLAGISSNANNYTHPNGDGEKHVPATSTVSGGKYLKAGSTAGSFAWSALTKEEITNLGIPAQDTTYSVATTSSDGLMSSSDKTKLNGIDSNANKYTHPSGDGNSHVPATGTGSSGKFLRAGASANSAAWTALTKADITGLGIPAQDTVYTHPTASAYSSGFYKITVNGTGHVTAAAPVSKSDLVALGIPESAIEYSDATTSVHGLMSTSDKAKLDAFGSASTYALKSDITNMYKYKGSKATTALLPSTGNTTGDVWNVEANNMNYAWDGSAWDSLGQIFTINTISNGEIDTIVAS